MLDDISTNNIWTETEYFFDSFGRVATESGMSHLGVSETKMYAYDYADNMTLEIHNISGANGVNHVSRHTYDHQGRLKFDRVNIDAQGLVTLGVNHFNHKDEVVERNIGRFATSGDHQYLQSIDYSYNTQGWLTGINDLFYDPILVGTDPCGTESLPELPEPMTNTDDQDLFALGIEYDETITGSGTPVNQNGNITTLRWWQNPGYTQTYSFHYDYLNRVTKAIHGEFDQSTYTRLDSYYEDFQYDDRGNILKLNRKGMIQRPEIDTLCYSSSTIDSLTYTYESGTNRLIQVQDNAPCEDVITLPPMIERDMTFAALTEIRVETTNVLCDVELDLISDELTILDTLEVALDCDSSTYVEVLDGPCPDTRFTYGFNQQSLNGQYEYDPSGNLTFDPNKDLHFHYNHLNLPYMIIGAHYDTLFTTIGADGSLLQRRYVRADTQYWKRDYIRGGKEYVNDTMEAIYHTDGRIIKDASSWSFEYWLKDHLGNVRVIFVDENADGLIANDEIRHRKNYYSFGYEHSGIWKDNEPGSQQTTYAYNGKELVEEMNLSLYNYGARFYDPVIGRWAQVEPAAVEYSSISPFTFTANNPIKFTELDGRRFYFAAGAGHDPDNTGYIDRLMNAFRSSGIRNPVDINAHGSKNSDVLFTIGPNKSIPYFDQFKQGIALSGPEIYHPGPDERITSAVDQIRSDLAANPLEEGEQFNLSGYSTGAVILAQAALVLANDGQVIDNLVLIGSPTTKDSDLFQALESHENIRNILRVDINGDNIQTISGKTLRSFLKMGDEHPHFKYAFNKEVDQNIRQLIQLLRDKGVE